MTELNELSTIEVNGVSALVREGTCDTGLVEEVIGKNVYKRFDLNSEDVVIDLGLNIGMFTIWALQKGVKTVHSYEPEADNFRLAVQNVIVNTRGSVNSERFFLHNAAVVGNDDLTRSFSVNVRRNKGAHSLISKRGRDSVSVDCININTIIDKVNPTVIKMDIEGAEYEVIKAIKANNWGNVRELIMEFHHTHMGDTDHKKYYEVIEILKGHFSDMKYREDPKKSWLSMIYCKR